MANHASHAALPYPVKNARFTIGLGYLDATGVPTDPVTPDTEISKDGGTLINTTEALTVVAGTGGLAWLTLTGAEMDCSFFQIIGKAASGPQATLIPDGRPRVLPVLFSGTATGGGFNSLTLGNNTPPIPAIAGLLTGCILKLIGGTGGGGTGGANNQARVITSFTTGLVAGITPNWEGGSTDNTTQYEVLLTETAYAALANLVQILGDDLAVTRLQRALNTEVLGTATGTPSTTNIPATLVPVTGATDQLKGRVVLFDRLTTTVNLRGQGTKITASTAGGTLTVDPLTHAPVAGDTFVVV